jgi:hypothetical protein
MTIDLKTTITEADRFSPTADAIAVWLLGFGQKDIDGSTHPRKTGFE